MALIKESSPTTKADDAISQASAPYEEENEPEIRLPSEEETLTSAPPIMLSPNKTKQRQMAGAAVVGGVCGLALAGPVIGVVAAGGAAGLCLVKGKVGEASRATGEAAASVGDRLKQVNQKHRITEKAANGVVKGANWVTKKNVFGSELTGLIQRNRLSIEPNLVIRTNVVTVHAHARSVNGNPPCDQVIAVQQRSIAVRICAGFGDSSDLAQLPQSADLTKIASKTIQDTGCWECDIVNRIVTTLQENPDAFLLDIGGNLGFMSLSAAAVQRDAYVLEPFEKNYRHLCRSVLTNSGFSDRVHLFNVAASQRTTLVQFQGQTHTKNFGGVSVRATNQDQKMDELREGQDYARGISLDSMRDQLPQKRPVVIKLDVEGAEISALMGGLEYFQETDILLAAMELRIGTLLAQAKETDQVFNLFRSKGLGKNDKRHQVATLLDTHT